MCVVCMQVWFYYWGCRVCFPLLLTCYRGVFVVGKGTGRGGTALSLFLAHYIIMINIIAVLLLVLQLFSF